MTRPRPSKDGTKGLWAVFSIFLSNCKINVGIKNSTVARLHKIPFVRTKPTSFPIVNFIRAMTRNPTMVVAPLAKMEPQASTMAFSMAASESNP